MALLDSRAGAVLGALGLILGALGGCSHLPPPPDLESGSSASRVRPDGRDDRPEHSRSAIGSTQQLRSPESQPAPNPKAAPPDGPPTEGTGTFEEADLAITAMSSPDPASEATPSEPIVPETYREPLHTTTSPLWGPATRLASLQPADCRALVQRRHLPFKRDRRPTRGVATALRFDGPIENVRFLAGGWKTPYGVLDCRLALVFVELAPVLAEHQVSQVLMGTMFRPSSRLGSGALSQHAHGLAADVVGFRLEDGTTLEVERDWPPELGEPPCGEKATVSSPTREALLLRNLVCDVARRGFFHVILTPNYDQPHHDHIHLDIKRDAKRMILR